MATTISSGRHRAENVALTGSVFHDVCLGQATFEDVNLGGATFHDVNLTHARLDDVNLSHVRVTNARVEGMTIDGIPVQDLLRVYRGQTLDSPPPDDREGD